MFKPKRIVKLATCIACISAILSSSITSGVQKKDDSQASDTKLVRFPLIVTDSEYHPIKNLSASDLTILDEGQPQKILSLSSENCPLRYGVLIDTSGSMKVWLPLVKETVKHLVNGNKPDDRTFIMRFSGEKKIQIVQDWTEDTSVLIESVDPLAVSGSTALFDSIYQAVDYVDKNDSITSKSAPHKAVIVLTDGDGGDSRHSSNGLIKHLRELDVQVFIFCFPLRPLPFPDMPPGPRYADPGKSFVKSFAGVSGGLALFPETTGEFLKMGNELTSLIRGQYVLTYSPTKLLGNGKYHKVRVQVGKSAENGLIVGARSGYTETVR